ncbi:hypothetical protein ACOME3_007421 [Neoechinorhynchus agilis]
MKRYGFKCGKGRNVKKSHRKRGSVNSGRKRRRIMAGTKMPGFMGNRPRMTKGLRVWRINTKYNVIYVSGPSIPGPMHSYVRVHDTTIDRKLEHWTESDHPPMPTHYSRNKPDDDEDLVDATLHRFSEPSLSFK